MAQLLLNETEGAFQSEQRYVLQKRMVTLGPSPEHDIVVRAPSSRGALFTLLEGPEGHQLLPGSAKIRVNGAGVSRATALKPCDRIEWPGGVAVYLASSAPVQKPSEGSKALESLNVLQNLAQSLQGAGSVQSALHQALDALVAMAGAEAGYLLAEMGRNASGWELVSSAREAGSDPQRKDLFSNTILQEALARREPVYVENIIGHPWAEAASVIEARIFSAACLPLLIGDRVFGAVFLLTRSPGRSIRKETLPELRLLAAQAALMLASQAELRRARLENDRLRGLVTEWPSMLVGMPEVDRKLSRLAPTPLSIVILGETGTGKELVAQELHRRSGRAQGPFVAINCAAIPATLLESMLFGHERGAFTGAVRSQPGKFKQAEGGTLFLDEIGDLPLELQAKLLRVLQEKQVEPLGAGRSIPVDVRVVAATHQDVEALVREGRFRQDLWFRLNGSVLRLPPLRERAEEIPALVSHFLRKAGSAFVFSSDALAALCRHPWPGNVRELEQVVTRAALLSEGPEIGTEDLELGPAGAAFAPALETAGVDLRLHDAQQAFTHDYVQAMLSRCQGNRTEAALRLGISERTLYRVLAADSPGRGV